MSDEEDLISLQKPQIKYCYRVAYTGLNPGKYEPLPVDSQISYGLDEVNREFEQIKGHATHKHLRQPHVNFDYESTLMSVTTGTDQFIQTTFEQFLKGLGLFREAIKYQKKGGILRKWLTIAYLWQVETERGHFVIEDVVNFRGFRREYAIKYLDYMINKGWINTYKVKRTKNARPFFCLSPYAKSLLLRGWVHSLGERSRLPGFSFTGDMLRGIRIELGIGAEKFAEQIGITSTALYRYERGTEMMSAARMAKVWDSFYFVFPVQYWPQYIKDEVNEGKRPRYDYERYLVDQDKKSHFEVINNIYFEWKKREAAASAETRAKWAAKRAKNRPL